MFDISFFSVNLIYCMSKFLKYCYHFPFFFIKFALSIKDFQIYNIPLTSDLIFVSFFLVKKNDKNQNRDFMEVF